MPAGLQIFSASGAIEFDTTVSVPNFFGKTLIGQDGSAASGSVYDTRYSWVSSGKARFLYILTPTAAIPTVLYSRPTVYLSGSYVVWNWPNADRIPFTLLYGIW